MNPRWSIVAALCVLAVARPAGAQTLPGAQTYQDNCQSCHGITLAGGRGPSLFSASILSSHSDDGLKQIVKAGVANSEMPPFAGKLSDDEIGQVIAYLHIRGGLEARLARAVYYPLIDLAVEEGGALGVWSGGVFFAFGAS